MADPRMATAVPFPLARPDAVLRYRTSDLVALSKAMGPPPREELSKPWMLRVVGRVQAEDVEFILTALATGLKAGDGFTPLALESPDDLRFPATAAGEPIVQALTLAMYGPQSDTAPDPRDLAAEAAAR